MAASEVDDLLAWLAPMARAHARVWAARTNLPEGVLFGFALDGAWEAVRRYDGRTDHLRGMASSYMVRRIVDGVRAETGARRAGFGREVLVGLPCDVDGLCPPTPEEFTEQVDARVTLAAMWPRVAASMPPAYVEVLADSFLGGLSLSEIGAQRGVSTSRVSRIRSQALASAAAAVA